MEPFPVIRPEDNNPSEQAKEPESSDWDNLIGDKMSAQITKGEVSFQSESELYAIQNKSKEFGIAIEVGTHGLKDSLSEKQPDFQQFTPPIPPHSDSLTDTHSGSRLRSDGSLKHTDYLSLICHELSDKTQLLLERAVTAERVSHDDVILQIMGAYLYILDESLRIERSIQAGNSQPETIMSIVERAKRKFELDDGREIGLFHTIIDVTQEILENHIQATRKEFQYQAGAEARADAVVQNEEMASPFYLTPTFDESWDRGRKLLHQFMDMKETIRTRR